MSLDFFFCSLTNSGLFFTYDLLDSAPAQIFEQKVLSFLISGVIRKTFLHSGHSLNFFALIISLALVSLTLALIFSWFILRHSVHGPETNLGAKCPCLHLLPSKNFLSLFSQASNLVFGNSFHSKGYSSFLQFNDCLVNELLPCLTLWREINFFS